MGAQFRFEVAVFVTGKSLALAGEDGVAQAGVADEPSEHLGDEVEAFRFEQHAGAGERLRHRAGSESQNRHIIDHRLDQWDAKAFVLAHTQENVCALITGVQLVLRNGTDQLNVVKL